MAFIQMQTLDWHEGERTIRRQMKAPEVDNPTVPALSPQLSNHLQIAPLIAIGTLDKEGNPWTTLWGNGTKGFAQPIAQGVIGVKTPITGRFDPVIEELFGTDLNGEVIHEKGDGRMVSGLTIDLETRKRVKMYGRMVAGSASMKEDEVAGNEEHVAEMQLVLKIEQSLGNCPKYLNGKHIESALAKPELLSDSKQLPQQALDLISKADLFFISSSQNNLDMDTNHRGGPAGFIRVESNEDSGAVLVYPEYSGNRLYQTLGNLRVNNRAGICVPDFDTGDMLYLTGRAEILVGRDAAALIPRSNLAVKISIIAARFVTAALPFRGVEGQKSPYNPVVRYLASEKHTTLAEDRELRHATLLSQTQLTPTISRFRFSLENAASHKAGQYVTLDLSSHLDMGYSHMRDEDPRSINDDFVRTFTISSPPGYPPVPTRNLKDDEFEITIRKVGVATELLFRHQGKQGDNRRRNEMDFEVGVKGFGGEFAVQPKEGETVCFIAAGVGITPLLPSLWVIDLSRLTLVWSVRKEDLGLVLDTLERHPDLRCTVFVTNASEGIADIDKLENGGTEVKKRRLEKGDLDFGPGVTKYYLCTPVPMRKQVQVWLQEKLDSELIFEDFNF